MDIYFCSFADSRYKPSLKRISMQAQEFKLFKEIFAYTEKDLSLDFVSKFSEKLIMGSKGYGYWVWKPYIILKTLNKLNENDVLLYVDVGCYLNSKGIARFKEYINIVSNSNSGLLTSTVQPHQLEKMYTKGDVFDYLNARYNKSITETPQIQSGIQLIKKTDETLQFYKRWLEVFENNFDLVNDSPSVSDNFPEFISERHDQSIFSILAKQFGVEAIPLEEFWVNDFENNSHLLKPYPIWAIRHKKRSFFGDIQTAFYRLMEKKKIKQ